MSVVRSETNPMTTGLTLLRTKDQGLIVQFLDLTLPTLPANLALDEALLLAAEDGGVECLRVWHWPSQAVVLGAGGKVGDDVDVAACNADGVPIARRSSGGGTVLLGPGCLLYSLVLRFDRDPMLSDLRASYRYILGTIVESLAPIASPLTIHGFSDLTWQGRKFSGNAQQRKRTHLLHHGTLLLHGFDTRAVSRYLKLPPRRPEYRHDRPHDEFLTHLPTDAGTLTQLLREIWHVDQTMSAWPEAMVEQLVAERYDQAEWVFRR